MRMAGAAGSTPVNAEPRMAITGSNGTVVSSWTIGPAPHPELKATHQTIAAKRLTANG